MAKDNSFDIVSEVDMQEMDNAVNQTSKEIGQRYDFKGSSASITLENENEIKLTGEDDYKLETILDMLRVRMAKRNVSLKCLNPGKIEPASRGTVRQTIKIEKGLSKEKAKDVLAFIKTLKLKVQAQIMDDKVRVTGAKRDDLQAVIQAIKGKDFDIDLQFINMR